VGLLSLYFGICACTITAAPLYRAFRANRFKSHAEAGTAALKAGEFARAEGLFLKSLRYAMTSRREWVQALIACTYNLGLALFRQRKYEQAAARFEEVVRLCSSRAPHWDLLLNAQNLLAQAYAKLGRYQETVTLYSWALEFIAEHPSSRGRLSAFQNGLGVAYMNLGEYGRALENLERSVELERQLEGDLEKASTHARFNLGVLYQQSGELDQAERIEEEVLTIREKASGRKDRSVAMVIANMAWLRCQQKRYEEAEALASEALTLLEGVAFEDAAAENKERRANVLHTLAVLRTRSRRLEEADELFTQAKVIRVGLLPPDHPRLLSLYGDIAELRMAQGRLAEAEDLLTAARNLLEAKLGTRHPHLAAVVYRLGVLRARQGRTAEAKDLLAAALAVKTRTAPRHPETEDCRKALEELAR
jgi:tetratricopeptide (TPR) repeat protein